jgi:hypothetical protein
MTGMKKGAGENPFADDEPDGDTQTGQSGQQTGEDEPEPEPEPKPEADGTATETESSRRQVQIPYKFRRDGVQDGRSRVPLFLKGETKRGERDAQRELEARFDDDVSLTDLREALVLVGLEHLDEVEDQLEEWGYGMTFDE